MPLELTRVMFISSIITSYYQKLVNLIYEGKEDFEEYDEYIEKIKQTIKKEQAEYNKLDLKTIKDYFNSIDIEEDDNPIEGRCFSRLSEREKVLLGEPRLTDNSTLSTVINSKIMIDTLKLVYQRIISLKDELIEEDENFINLIMYYNVSKFTYLTDSSFIEKIALQYNFDINEIPSISFEEINKAFNIDILKDSTEIFYYKIFEELDALYYISEKDQALNTYLALSELSRIQVLLSYIDEETLDKVIGTYQANYGDSKKDTMINAEMLIKKRKKEFK